ncbi:MAG: peptidoglycan DD-metalloendopeptidase family protein [Cyclobacteriaceae bacterium]|nr:peptidoglycan DD-metalloendopeptidase family protein [Cyclobacteriaceae bacterium]
MGQVTKSKNQLEKEKKDKLNKIKEVEKILSDTRNEKKNTIGELNALNQRINAQEGLIRSIRNEVNYLNHEIDETNEIIASLEDDLDKMKEEYGAMIYATYKANRGVNKLTFLFSSESFSQLRARVKYMEQYGIERKKQAEQIKKVTLTLQNQIEVIEVRKNEKSTLLTDVISENQNLLSLKTEQKNLISNLENQESKLRSNIEDTKKAVAQLDNMINEMIRAEIAKSESSSPSVVNIELSKSFASNKAKFPWPVTTGFISQKFGRHKHPVLSNVWIENDGINIQTTQNSKAISIFSGEVRHILFIPNIGYTTIIKHGEYYTIYSGLKEPVVKRGDTVSVGQELGELVTNSEGVTELRFELRKGREPQDPELWLSKK